MSGFYRKEENTVIDLHSHILPYMDDGSRDWEETILMAEAAWRAGTRIIAATPHCRQERGSGYLKKYRESLFAMRKLLKERGIALSVVSGMEIFADGHTAERLRRREVLPVNGGRYVLTEFDFEIPSVYIYREIESILQEGYIPILAHPERYRCAEDFPQHVCEWNRMGAVIQINKGSVMGDFGTRVKKTADRLLRLRLAHIAASDAHRSDRRTARMDAFSQYFGEKYGEWCPRILLWENPVRILEGRSLPDMDPLEDWEN